MDRAVTALWVGVGVLLGASTFMGVRIEQRRAEARRASATVETGDLVSLASVVDGDSVVVTNADGSPVVVRILGIKALDGAGKDALAVHGQAAQSALREKLADKPIRVLVGAPPERQARPHARHALRRRRRRGPRAGARWQGAGLHARALPRHAALPRGAGRGARRPKGPLGRPRGRGARRRSAHELEEAVTLFELMRRLRRGVVAPPSWLRVGAMLVAVIAYGATGYVYFELEQKPELSLVDGLWWAIVTVTTVGYGDHFPVSPAGRFLVAGPLMLFGIGLLGYVVSFATSAIVEAKSRELRGMRDVRFEDHVIVLNYPSLDKLERVIDELRTDPPTSTRAARCCSSTKTSSSCRPSW
jgi:hypothetical protein